MRVTAMPGTGRRPASRDGFLVHLLRTRTARVGIAIVLGFAVAAILAPLLVRHDPAAVGDLAASASRPPSREHWLGTDAFGRDLYSRLLYGGRVSLAIGFSTAALAAAIGTAVGLVAGYRGGRLEEALMRGVDLMIAFPRLFLVLLVVALVGPSIVLVVLMLASTGWMSTARLVRAQVWSLRRADYVLAAVALGMPLRRVLWRHILPNVSAPIIVSATLIVGQTILIESGLSFLGFGVQVPTPSWGAMIDEGRRAFPGSWWVSLFPGMAITLTVVGYNLLGDALRDALDPRLRTWTP